MKRVLFIAALVFFLPYFLFSQHSEGKNTRIIILHTNDMHAKIDNLSKVAYLADSLRKMNPYVFLVAAGDNFTGNPVVDMVDDKGAPMIDLMNRCGFNISAIGNHEFDLGQDFLNKRMSQAKFPFICCNVDATGAVLKQPEPYTILKAGDLSLAFLGIIELGENGLPDSHPAKLNGLSFSKGLDKAKEFSWLKKKYPILIGLTHLGIDTDIKLAQSMPELDVIIGGHSHTLIDTLMLVNNVLITQAGSSLKYIGKVVIDYSDNHIVSIRDEIIDLATIKKKDPEVQALIDKYNANPELQKLVGIAATAIKGNEELGAMMTDAITKQMSLDFAFQNSGGIRVPEIPAGNILLKDVYRLDPFGNEVIIYHLSKDEISSLIANSFNREKRIDLMVSGMTYSIKTNPDGTCKDVIMKDPAGKTLDPEKKYSVAMNSYMAASYKFDHHDPGQSAFITTAQVLIDYLKHAGTVNYSGTRRTSVY
ncbi:MAG: bifunctional UDP-sugar hydrolase/5'-nucleotidase [Bacteroidota bacterium]|nr:bifunctional UDP-sugar hydrolase/5'-nucleotidase [Bacteroidota bacterium]